MYIYIIQIFSTEWNTPVSVSVKYKQNEKN